MLRSSQKWPACWFQFGSAKVGKQSYEPSSHMYLKLWLSMPARRKLSALMHVTCVIDRSFVEFVQHA